MPTLNATPGDAAANSFCTLIEFQTYLDERLNVAALLDETEDDQMRALLEGTRDLTLLPYVGTRVTTTQALAWPRQYAINPDIPNLSVITDIALLYFPITVVPSRVKIAQIEYAIAFLKAGTTDIAALDTSLNIKRKRTDVLETEYVDTRASGLARFPRVVSQLAPLLDPAQAGSGLTVVRV